MLKLRLSRRTILHLGPAALVSFLSVTCSRTFSHKNNPQPSAQLPPTPACGNGSTTTAQIEGPFYTPDSPLRQSLLEPGLAGTPMMVTGRVLSLDCVPIAGALVDFWHTDDQGAYDNSGYRFRGHQFTDAEGRYSVETIVPGIYQGRTSHFHVKVQAPNQPVLTTQLYFPDEAANQGDIFFSSTLLLSVEDRDDRKRATFDFVLKIV